MKELRKKTISVLMTLVMLVGILADFGWGGSVEVLAVPYGAIDVTCKDLKINGADYKEGMPVPDNAQFEFTIQWKHTNEETFPMSLDIPLPEGIKFDVKTEQQITLNAQRIGSYTISGGFIHAKFDKTLKGNVSGDFEVSGTLDGDKIQTDENGKTSLNIYDKTILINVTDSSDIHQLSVKKSYDGPYDMEKGLTFHVEVTSFGTNENIRLDDIFDTNKMDMVDFTSIEVTSTKGYKIDGGTLEQNNDGFSYVFPSDYKMGNNETCSFSYQLKFKDSAFAADYVSGSNKVIASSKTDRKEVTTWFSADKNWIEKKGTYNKGDNTITWTITLNKGLPLNIAGAQLKDILPSGTKIVSDITINGSDGFSTVIPMDSASSDFQYTFPTDRDCSGVYTVTYKTDAVPNKDYNTITGGYTDNNLAKIDVPKFGEHEKYANVYIPGIGNILDKRYTEVKEDVKNKTVRVKWNSTIKLPETLDLSNLTYTDTVAKGTWEHGGDNHRLDKNSIIIRQGGTIIQPVNYSLNITSTDNDTDYVNDTFTISFGDYFQNRRNDGDVTIEYETTFKMPAENIQLNGISNTGTVTINKTSQSDTENLPYKYVPAVSKFFKGTINDNTEFLWAVTINLDNVKLQNSDIIYIREELPENHKYVEKSIVAVVDQYNAPNQWNSKSTGITETIGNDYITFRIDTSAVQKVDGQNIVILWYHTKIDDYKEFLKDKEGTKVYTNTVTVLDKDQNPVGTAQADAKNIVPVQGTILNKNFEYSASTAPNVHYYINVNTDRRKLLEGHDGDKLLLTDVMGSALQYVPNTFKVYKNPQRSELLDNSEWNLTYDVSANTLYVKLPDETPCYISYDAKVLLEPGEKLENADNSVTLTGDAQTSVTDNKYLSGTVLKSSANVYSDIGFFELFKYDKENALIGIPNAEYTATICYKWVGGENGHPELFDPALESNQYPYYEPQRRYITEAGGDKNGTVVIDNIYPDKLYKIQEVTAPNGYKLNTEPVYYYIVGNDKADFNMGNLPAEFADAKIVKAVAGQVIPVFDEKEIPLETISVKKVTNSGDVLEGARLSIYDETVSTTEPMLTWTSSTEPKAISVNVDSTQPTEKGVLETGKTYTLKEELPPDGYLAAGEFKFNISTDGKINIISGNPNYAVSTNSDGIDTITITDNPAIFIRKIADDTGKLLSGATLKLTKTDDASFSKKLDSSSADKPWVLELADGEYTLTETHAPTGYQIADPITFTVEYGKITNAPDGCVDDKGIILTMTDKAVGKLKIKKVDFADGKTPIEDIGFSLFEADGTTLVYAEKSTNADGIIEFENIPYGTYVLKETSPLSGYVSNQEKYYVTISHKEEEITITNTKEEKNTGNISIKKTNADGSVNLSGAKFKLVNDPTDTATAKYSNEGTTNNDGELVFPDVPYGKYLLEEVEAPFGYTLVPTSVVGGIENNRSGLTQNSSNQYPIELSGTENNLTFNVDFCDQQLLGTLEITKTDDVAKPIQGVAFELWKDGVRFRDSQSTGTDGKCTFDNLPYGEYILKETSTPPGYEAASDQKVTINESKDVQIKRVPVINNRKSIFIGKTAVDDTKQLPGAEFEICDEDGKSFLPAITFTSDATKKQFYLSSVENANELVLGKTYILKETAPPTPDDGSEFKIGPNVKFKIAADTNGEINIELVDSPKNAVVSSDGLTLTMQDERIGTITLTKMDAFKNNGSDVYLENAEFEVYAIDESGNARVIEGLTDGNGKIGSLYKTGADASDASTYGKFTISNLPYGIYKFVEINPPAGYDMPANPNTIVVLAHPAEGVSVYNQKTTDPLAEIELLKVNAEGHPLEGAEFSLYQYQGEGETEKLVYVASGTSDADGNVTFNNSVPYDKVNGTKCQIKETKAPKDYQLNDTGIDILLNSTTVVDGVYHPERDDSLSSDYIKIKDGKIQVVNKLITVDIQVVKIDDDHQPISGITFKLFDSNGNIKYTGETDSDGKLTIPEISYGEYILEETQPKYHFLNGDGKIRLYLNDSTVELKDGKYQLKNEVKVTNNRKTISISKKDLNEGTLISGAMLQLTSDNGSSKIWITGTDVNPFVFYLGEQIDMNNNILAPGKYTLTEEKEPEGKGYLISDPISFEILEDGTIKVDQSKTEADYAVEDAGTQLVMYDKPYGQIQVTKVNAKNPDVRLNGAVFGLYMENDEAVLDSEGNPITGTTGKGGAEGVVTFPKVPYGTYILREIIPPSGFIKRGDIRVTVDKSTRNALFIVECTVANTPEVKTANIHIKKEVDGLADLPDGFEFALYRKGDFANPILVQPVINGEVTFSNILFGTYYIRETNAPFGYSPDPVSVKDGDEDLELYEPEDNVNKPKFYEITVDSEVPSANSKEILVTVKDELAKAKLKITKVEQGTRKPIAGIRFELRREGESDVLYSCITNDKGELVIDDGTNTKLEDKDLLYGNYILTELNTGEVGGYTFPKNYIFPVGENETPIRVDKETVEIEISNEPKTGSFTIKKLDIENPIQDDDEEGIKNTNGLSGAVYYLYNVSAELVNPDTGELTREPVENERDLVAVGTTGNDGTYKFNNIPYGTYYLKEEKAPLNYDVSSDYKKIVIPDDSENLSYAAPVRDKKLTATFTLQKIDSMTGTPLADAEFVLRNEDGKLVKTDENGGYVDAIEDTDENKAGDGIIRKTGDDGKLIYMNLPYGNYTLTEEKAPVNYKIIQKEHSIYINQPDVPYTVMNESVMFQISKRIKRGGISDLEGAELQLLDSTGTVVRLPDENGELQDTWKTSSTTPKMVCIGDGEGKIRPGTYTLKEVGKPEGYAAAQLLTFTVNGEGQLVATGTGFPLGKDGNPDGEIINENTLVMYDDVASSVEPKTIKISKASMDGDLLDGAELRILSVDESVVVPILQPSKTEPWITKVGTQIDEANDILLMYNEVYILREVKAPEGFKKADDIYFRINFDGEFEILSGVDENNLYKALFESNHLIMLDKAEGEYKISISKKAVGGTEELGGTEESQQATLQIVDENGEVVEEWQTGTEPHIVEVGGNAKVQLQKNYWLRETDAPDGYTENATDIRFRVNSDGTISSAGELNDSKTMLTMRDAVNETNIIYISKKAVNGTNELPGAHFDILISNPDGTDGAVVIKDLESSEQANRISAGDGDGYQLQFNQVYILRETKAPDGYLTTDDIRFAVQPDGTMLIADEKHLPVLNSEALSADGKTLTMRDPVAPTPDAFTDDDGVPKTGDDTPIVLLILLLVAAVVVIAGLFVTGRRKSKREEEEDDTKEEDKN